MTDRYYRKGFGLKQAILPTLTDDYHSQVVDRMRESGHALAVDDLTIRLAKEFGFCYGVDRAVEYAYESRTKFPERRIFLVGEIIHNPHVNTKLEHMGVIILHPGEDGRFDFGAVEAEDVVLIPAFGVQVGDFARLRELGCVLVDTTCGSVLNVWKRVERYARDGFTSVVHGKHYHEETKATVSQVTKHAEGRYLVVRDMSEAEVLCGFIRGEVEVERMETMFRHKVSDGFDFERDLQQVGVANQTTMLAGESLAIAAKIGEAMAARYGDDEAAEHFRNFDTICSATQERQDALLDLIEEPLDVMIVIGGYNSSNTANLARIASRRVTTYHIADATCIDVDAGAIRFKPIDEETEATQDDWLAPDVQRIGITAGASTPNNKIGEAIERVLRLRGLAIPT
jgi:4-hydroxy-3-methylbut-2-enyl diphosphate reductase